jgi:catalase
MKPTALFLAATLLLLNAASPAEDAATTDTTPLPVALVDALNHLAGGPHPGYRANHAKGVLATGSFHPTRAARNFSKAPQFAAEAPVLVRFSDATGVPTLPDANPNASPHGLAIRFTLPHGATTDIVSISANGFPVATPEDFLALLRAVGQSGPDAAKPTPIEQFLGSHPAALRFVTTPRPAPQSFATLAFYGVNAFRFTNAQGKARYGRYQIVPEAGEHALDAATAESAAPDYLVAELPARIAQGPVVFHLYLQLAAAGDPLDDPTATWPADRERIELGTLRLTGVPAEQVEAQRALLFNPLSLPEGIEPSADPVLLARPAAYAVSYTQRVRQP